MSNFFKKKRGRVDCFFTPFAPFAAKKFSKEREKRPTGAVFGKRAGAKPHGREDKVMPPKKPILAHPTFNREPTLSGADWERRHAAGFYPRPRK